MNALTRRLAALERLEAARALPAAEEAEEAARARQRLMADLARYAESAHREDEALAAGQPLRVLAPSQRSPVERLVRAAMDEAAQDGPWGSPAYGNAFWRSTVRRLGALLDARRGAAAEEGTAA